MDYVSRVLPPVLSIANFQKTLSSCISFHLGFSNQTLVVHGSKNSGKSSLLSRASSLSFDWFSSNCCIVYRCIGETPDSSVLTLLLRSVCLQISHAYGRPLNIIPSVCFCDILLLSQISQKKSKWTMPASPECNTTSPKMQ